MTAPTQGEAWNARYREASGYLYGTEPNDFLVDATRDVAPGDALCLADGEGRNGVYLARCGHRVSTIDISRSGVDKATRLAAEHDVELTTIVADLADYDFVIGRWDLIVSIFAHTPPSVRRRVHAAVVDTLRPGGRFVLEAYTPDQIGRGTGGPPHADLAMTLTELERELTGLTVEHGVETVRTVVEGDGHTGDGSVVQLIARKPER